MPAIEQKAKALSVAGVFVAIVFFCFSFGREVPQMLAQHAQASFGAASVSTTAAVEPNPYNTLAAQLAEKEARLNVREQTLDTQTSVRISPDPADDSLGFYSLVASMALFLLTGMNFFFDIRRARREAIAAASPAPLSASDAPVAASAAIDLRP